MFVATSIKVLNSVYSEGLAEEASKLQDFLLDTFELEHSRGMTIYLRNKWFKATDYIKVYFKIVKTCYILADFYDKTRKPLQKSEIPEEELWKYNEYVDMEFEVELHDPMDPEIYIY